MKKFSKKGRVILLTSLTIFVLFTTCIASFAWFMTVSPTTPLETISGSMDISIKKVSAYRYVYPYFNSSDTYIDYTQNGNVKEVVMKDSQIKEMGNLPSQASKPKNDKNYYLIGNSTFLGDGTKEYSLDTGLTFFSKLDNSYQISDVIISAGSIFGVSNGNGNILLKNEGNVTGMEEFTFKDGFLQAKTAGRYSLTLTFDDGGSAKLKIEKTKRTDDAILSMTLFDPTYAKLYSSNVATAIKDQNTLLVYDVTLDVKNEDHDFLLSCDVKRSTSVLEYPISNYLSYQIEKANGSLKFSNDIYKHFHDKESNDGSLKTFDESTSSLNILFEEIESTSQTTSCHYYIAIDYVANKLNEFMKESNLGRSFDLKRDYTFYFSSSQIIHEKGSQSNEKE